MSKLLIFHPIIAPYRIDYFNALSKQFDTKICLLWKNLQDQTFDYSKIEEQFHFAPTYLTRKTLKIQRGIFSTIREFNPDVVLVSECGIVSVFAIVARFLFRKKYAIVSIVDDSYNMVAENNYFSWSHKIAEKILFPFFDNIICVEPRVVSHFQRLYGKGICFPIIVDETESLRRYGKILPISETYVRNYGLQGKIVLLFVGRLVELKNIQMVIPVFRRLESADIRFVLVGSGDYEDQLKNLAQGDDRIIFVGRKEGDELYAWYNIASCFVLASYQEAFGAVTNEALLGGCWCLVSEKAGSNCLIEDGKNGFIFDPHNSSVFEEKLRLSLQNSVAVQLPLCARKSLMQCSFNDMLSNVIKELQKSTNN